MTREEILAMQPGRELDAEIALRIFGVKEITVVGKHYFIDPLDKVLPSYSTDISAAWEVIDKFYYVDIRKVNKVDEDRSWKWAAWVSLGDGYSHNATADTAPEAICKAALLAVLRE